jgi:hypothetical protein
MWDLEQRMQEETQKVIEEKDKWQERFFSMKDEFTTAHRAKYAFLKVCHDTGAQHARTIFF